MPVGIAVDGATDVGRRVVDGAAGQDRAGDGAGVVGGDGPVRVLPEGDHRGRGRGIVVEFSQFLVIRRRISRRRGRTGSARGGMMRDV
nr:MAG: hypothetical protein DIU53_01270 [Thermobifida fusca]